MMKVAVLGAGAMGAAVSIVLERAGHEVALCGTQLDSKLLEAFSGDRTHPALGAWLPEPISLFDRDSWDEALRGAAFVVVAVASAGVRSVVEVADPLLSKEGFWAVVTKGWDPESALPLSDVVGQVSRRGVVLLSGPTLAVELAAGTPSSMVCASAAADACARTSEAFAGSNVSIECTDDVIGVSVASALKNVLAIAVGLCDGLTQKHGRPMTNAKAALFAKGLADMASLVDAVGGRRDTVIGVAGAGDLFVTVHGGRNGRFGRLVGSGLDPAKAFAEMGTTVEGFENTREALNLAKKKDLRLPIVEMVHAVLFEGMDADDAVTRAVAGN